MASKEDDVRVTVAGEGSAAVLAAVQPADPEGGAVVAVAAEELSNSTIAEPTGDAAGGGGGGGLPPQHQEPQAPDAPAAAAAPHLVPHPPSPVGEWTLWHRSAKRMAASKRHDLSSLPPKVRAFYRKQNELIDSFLALIRIRRARGLSPFSVGGGGAGAAGGAHAFALNSSSGGGEDGKSGAGDGGGKSAAGEGPAVSGSGAVLRRADDSADDEDADTAVSEDEDSRPAVRFAINASFAANVVLFVAKVIAAATSGSFAVIASVVDSALDLLSGSILYVAARVAARRDTHGYPIGKTRLEPVAVVVFASVMAVAALQLFSQALQSLVEGYLNGRIPELDITASTYGIIGGVVLIKSALLFICYRLQDESASVEALAADHFNDVMSNSVTLATIAIASRFAAAWAIDPLCAMAVALLIVRTWVLAGKEQVQQLTGRVASPEVLGQLTFIALSHAPHTVLAVDTVRAYHVGNKILAEVDIVLPEEMPLRAAHDIGEALQNKLELHPEVERAHVHLDFETSHSSEDEHVYPM